ncbi:multiple monosaccharide ABC transporter ATP-binding protein [Microbacterium dextranolyticum]|uniref:Xylose ABC transporter ATP-binding protein n=1 Tax=Microbacterium dextranolyticum TaxID=36806 RepID=A0A9W6M545_9MICO|nr:multiple monosaccharide ABC transporter ATP-binding protein [Microbacterium dextranolyticum]MBM7461872.1 putative multiple sugar transport system ATP-binding protein [Microbacterium dextranolyticum]GLJ94113.1 xylose ABC transporter ATP-binding protein [Microbacterium dextranolyticum]
MTEHSVILEMRHIVKEFPGVRALDDVTMSVRRGEIHSICGENGAGKSTLMKVLSGVYPHGTYEGEILLDGQEVEFKDIKSSERAGIVIIHQELALIPELSVTENIFLGNEIVQRGIIDWSEARGRALELMARVGLEADPDTAVKNLGVGQQQLVEIARALSKNVRLLILDEPTSALNEEDSANLLALMKGLRSRGIAQIMISHKLNEIAEVSDSVTVIRDGRTVETYDVTAGDVDEDRIIRAMVGRSLDHRYPEHTPDIGDVLFEVRDWRVEHPQIPGRYICKDSSFVVRAGEIVGFAGLMGAGRTELARSLFGRNYGIYRSGQMFIRGREVHATTVQQAIRAGLAYVPEDRKTLGLNLLDTIKATIVSANLGAIVRGGLIDGSEELSVANGYRTSLRIKSPSVDVGISTLSGGNQQKAVLAKWMFPDPDVLILDEPTRGIDVGAKYEIYKLIHELADAGKAVVVISSELPELLGMSDRIYTICEGRITGELAREEADQERLMRLMTTSSRDVA